MTLLLYHRHGCHLCDELESLVRARMRAGRACARASIVKRDIDTDENWRNLYGDRIPVIEHDGRVILEGRPSVDEVDRTLRAIGL